MHRFRYKAPFNTKDRVSTLASSPLQRYEQPTQQDVTSISPEILKLKTKIYLSTQEYADLVQLAAKEAKNDSDRLKGVLDISSSDEGWQARREKLSELLLSWGFKFKSALNERPDLMSQKIPPSVRHKLQWHSTAYCVREHADRPQSRCAQQRKTKFVDPRAADAVYAASSDNGGARSGIHTRCVNVLHPR